MIVQYRRDAVPHELLLSTSQDAVPHAGEFVELDDHPLLVVTEVAWKPQRSDRTVVVFVEVAP